MTIKRTAMDTLTCNLCVNTEDIKVDPDQQSVLPPGWYVHMAHNAHACRECVTKIGIQYHKQGGS